MSGRDQMSARLLLYDVDAPRAGGAGALNAPTASAGLDNRDVAVAVGQTFTFSDRTVNETRGQVAWGHLRGAARRPDRPGGEHRRRGHVRNALDQPDRARSTACVQIVDTLSHQRGAHAWRAGVDVLVNDDTITFPRSSRGAYTFSSLANFLAGTYNTSGFTQTFGATEVSQSSPAVGVYVQDEWKAGAGGDVQPRPALRPAVDRDRSTPTPTTWRRGSVWPGRRPPRGAACVRGGAGLYFDRVPLRAVANALLSAGNTTDLTQLRQINVSLSPAQAGAPVFPACSARRCPRPRS